MRRWALVVAGTMVAVFLFVGYAMPTFQSVADDSATLGSDSTGNQDGADLGRDKPDKKRPSLGGTQPSTAPSGAPAVKPKVSEEPSAPSTYSKAKKTPKSRPNLMGPTPVTTPPTQPVASPKVSPVGPVVPTPVGPVGTTPTPVTPTVERKDDRGTSEGNRGTSQSD